MILGAGFAGLECARKLAGSAAEVTVVDRHNFHTFQPLLYQVATSALSPSDVAYPVRGILRGAPNVSFRHGSVENVDWEERVVRFADATPLPFDYLVVATGATASWFGVPGAEEHTLPLYALSDAIRVRNHVLSQFEQAEWERATGVVANGRLTFLVVGGGPTGVEMAGALHELFTHVLAHDFPELERTPHRIVLLEMADSLLSSFSARAQRHAATELQKRGVELRFGAKVAEVTAEAVILASAERIPTRTVIWAAGVRANDLANRLGVAQAPGGRITVAPDLSIPGRSGAFAAGDIAAIPGPRGPLPQLAPVAKQSGAFVARQILDGDGQEGRGFRYRDKGTMATVGRNAAVADIPPRLSLTGRLAWLAWLLLHLMYLAGFRNRLSVVFNWVWTYFTYERGHRVIVEGETVRTDGRGPTS